MKKQLVMISLLSATLGAGVAVSHAAPPPDGAKTAANEPAREAPQPDRMKGPPGSNLKWQKNLLKLTDDQEKKIGTIITSEQVKIRPLLQKRDDLHKRLFEIEQAVKLDEKALGSIAGELAKTETELIVSHVKTNRKVSAVLTPEQRKILNKLDRKSKLHHGPPKHKRDSPPDCAGQQR